MPCYEQVVVLSIALLLLWDHLGQSVPVLLEAAGFVVDVVLKEVGEVNEQVVPARFGAVLRVPFVPASVVAVEIPEFAG